MDSLFANRRAKLLEYMKNEGPSVTVITSPLNICYLTGARIEPYERLYALVIDASVENYSFIFPSVDSGVIIDNTIERITYNDTDDPVRRLRRLADGKDMLGLEYDALPYALYKRLNGHTDDMKLSDISPVLKRMRLTKNKEEVDLIREAVLYSDEIFGIIAPEVKPGVSEKQMLSRIFNLIAERKGTTISPYIIQVLGGPNASNPHGHAGDRRLEKGEPLTIDYGVCYDYYWSDCTRTFFAGAPGQKFEIIYKVVLAAQQAAIKKAKPGVTISDIDRAARQVIENAGYGEYFIHRTGHGIGLDIHEQPYIHSLNGDLLESGMTVTIEPGIYMPGFGGVRIEDDLLITETGAEVLSSYPKSFGDMVID